MANAYFDPPFTPITDFLPERHSQSSVRHCQRPFLHCSNPGLRLAKTSLYLAMARMRLCDFALNLSASANTERESIRNKSFRYLGLSGGVHGGVHRPTFSSGPNPDELRTDGIRATKSSPAANGRSKIWPCHDTSIIKVTKFQTANPCRKETEKPPMPAVYGDDIHYDRLKPNRTEKYPR